MDDIRDIKGPVGLAAGWPLWGLAGAVTLFALGGLAVWRWRRVARPRDCALTGIGAALDGLVAEAARLDDRDYYYRLAGLVRQALALRLDIAASAMTSAEIGPILSALPEAQGQALAGLLARADAARYAGESVSPRDRLADAQIARRLLAGRPWP